MTVLLLCLATTTSVFGQIVSAGLTGLVRDTAGGPVVGATVTAVHRPTNATAIAVTNQFGRFSLRGLPVGGPFSVTSSADGFTTGEATDVFTELGSDVDVTLTLKSNVVVMEKYTASASSNDLDATAAGTGSILNSDRIAVQPNLNRSFADMIRTNAFVTVRAGGDRITAVGQNNRFNSISVDGARITDAFGINASGLFSFNNPFSLDALEQFSVDISPYDVRRSGFTGASINAVTKSGTNEFHGSAYYIVTDEDLQQPDIIGANANIRTFSEERTYGYTLGGPIFKNRLFFFANWERSTRDSVPVAPVYMPNATDLATIQSRLAQINTLTSSSFDFGGISGGANRTQDTKRLIKLDWNINADHRMTLRYSDTVGTQPSFGGLNSTSFSGGAPLTGAPSIGRITALTSNFYTQLRKERVKAGQIFSNWTPSLKTALAYSKVSLNQDSPTPINFPEVRIYNVAGTDTNTGAAIPNGVVVLGTENARHGNKIDVLTETYSASADYNWGRFTFSGGADHEESSFLNLFRQASYGVFGFNGVTNFVNDVPFAFGRALVQNGFEIADISEFEQTGLFAQVKTELSQRLNFTLGLRYDTMGSAIPPTANPAFAAAFGVTNASTIDGTDLLAPRASFNYAVDSERRTQVRGGLGVILGRNPWVWISNAYSGTGVGRFADQRTTTSPTLVNYLNTSFDPENPIGTSATAPVGGVASMALNQPGLKLPSIMRGNLAVDHKLPFLNATITAEYVHTDVIDAMFIDNINLRPIGKGADGRERFGFVTNANGSVSAGTGTAPRVAGYSNVLRLRNVDTGGSQYFSIGIDRPMRNDWAFNVSYTRGYATEAQNMGSSTAGSTWQFNAVFNQNAVETRRSDFEIRDRIQAGIAKRFRYKFGREMATTLSLYYEGRTGSPYSWVYASDLNTDGFTGNDVLAVPSGPSDARFDFTGLSTSQLDTFLGFFRTNGLAKFAGAYAPKNSFIQPYQHRLDLRVMQEIGTFKKVKVELFADFINFGSWLSDNLFNYVETLPIPTNTGLVRNLGSNVTGTTAAPIPPSAVYNTSGQIRINPVGMFDSTGAIIIPSNSAIAVNNGESRWRIQLGARVKF